MSNTLGSEVQQGLEGLYALDDWADAVEIVQDSLRDHPADGADQFDPFNLDHLHAQIGLVDAMKYETETRQQLGLEVASPAFDSLDVIAKLALLHSLGRFVAPPISAHAAAQSANRFRGQASRRTFGWPEDEPKIIRSVDGVLAMAGKVDATLRQVDDTLEDGSEVEVTEVQRWSELRTLHRRGEKKTFQRVITTAGIVDNRDSAFPLEHPVVEAGVVQFDAPSSLRGVRVVSRKGKSTRDMGEPRPELESRLTPYSEAGTEHPQKSVDVPLIAAKQAQGLSTDRYVSPRSDMTRNEMIVNIGSHALPKTLKDM